ncbi:MAG: hypothetical protein HYU29_01455 [Chloroflexi bacterium]|nr:hypothetical protein [Chloroflexota bacterium]
MLSKGIWRLGLIGLLGGALVALAACGGGVSQEEYNKAKEQLASEQQKATVLQQQLSSKIQESSTLQQQVAAKDKEVADLKAKPAAATGVRTLIGAQQIPTPTPRPTATPLPPGVPTPTAAPAVRVPPEIANEVLPFVFYVETLATTSVGIDGWSSTVACVPNTVFKRGMKLVWRFEVFDTSVGKRVTDLEGATVKIRLSHGEDVTARYSRRGGVGPWTWAAGWNIPLDYPLGAFAYKISVTTKDGRTGTFDPDKVALVRAATATAAGIDSRVQIID